MLIINFLVSVKSLKIIRIRSKKHQFKTKYTKLKLLKDAKILIN